MSYNFTYLDSPEFLLKSLHITTAISTPFYFLGMYCILFKTPDSMESVKWYICTLHFWTVVVDYSICLLTVPFLMIPELVGTPFGVLRYLGVPTSLQTVYAISSIGFMLTSIVSIYENRFYILCDFRGRETWAWFRYIWLASHYIVAVIAMTQFYNLMPEDQEAAKQVVFKRLPPLPDHITKDPALLVVATDITYARGLLCFILFIFVSEIVIFTVHLIQYFKEQKKSMRMSRRTYEMHQKLLIALVTQVTIPFITLVFPICYGVFAVTAHYFNLMIMNFCAIAMSSHGLVSTVVMIILHRPYREAVITMIRAKKVSSLYVSHSDASYR